MICIKVFDTQYNSMYLLKCKANEDELVGWQTNFGSILDE